MNRRQLAHVRWLYEELPRLIEAGILPDTASSQLKKHYGEVQESQSMQERILIIFGILGALLVGFGIILLVAVNWHLMPRAIKLLFSLLPLLLGQAVVLFARWQRPASTSWQESSTSFLTLAIGASLALVSQVFQITGSPGQFMLTWLLLAAAIPYLSGARMPAILYLIGVLLWRSQAELSRIFEGGQPSLLLYLIVASIPLFFVARIVHSDPDGIWAIVLRYAYVPVAFAGVLSLWEIVFDNNFATHGPLIAGASLAIALLMDQLWQPSGHGRGLENSLLARPFRMTGLIGLSIFGLAMSFSETWSDALWNSSERLSTLGWLVLGLTVLTWLLLLLRGRQDETPPALILGLLPATVFIGSLIAGVSENGLIPALLVNLHLVILSLVGIVLGLKFDKFGWASSGLGLACILILLRFMDIDLGLLPRAIAFILIGCAFLIANVIIARRMR